MSIRSLLIPTLFAIVFSGNAAEGDTLRVQSHQETHWDWNGSWYDTTAFPAEGSYRRILMYYTLGCPSIGCSEWDYTTRIEVGDPVNDSTTRWVELTRIITPYAGDKGASWKHTWVIDVTDYAPVLTGERVIRAQYDGWQDGFTVTINFDFIEGIPPREVLDVTTLYDGIFKYGFANDPIENYLIPKDITMHDDLASAKFRIVASGHSFGGAENCAEFCQKWYKLNIDGVKAVQEDIWRDDCGSNPLEDQTGTWIYNRAGWCPGDVTKRFDTDISLMVDAGSTHEFNVDWESYNYTGGAGFDPQYGIEATIFQYGEWSHNLDVAIDNVLKPSMQDRFSEMNPICNNPEIVISNTGNTNVTKVLLEYWVEGSPEIIRHEYKGLLLPGVSETIVLPSYDKWLFGGKTKNVFHVKVAQVNGVADDYEGNNHFISKFADTKVLPENFIIAFNNNNGGNETKYYVISERGDVLYSRTNAVSGAQYLDTISLEKGCYTLRIEDQGCDGLKFFANSDGTGRIWLHPAEGSFFPPLHQFEDGFGCEAVLSFTVGYELGEPETMDYPAGIESQSWDGGLMAFPVPSVDKVTLVLKGDLPLGGQLRVLDLTGRQVFSALLNHRNGTELVGLAGGTYVAHYSTSTGISTVKFTIL